MGDGVEMPEEKQTDAEAALADDQAFYPYLKQELNLHLLHDNTVYKSRDSWMPLIAHLMRHDKVLGTYDPILYLSDFWVLMRDLVLVDIENLDRIRKVQAGEKQEGEESMDEKAIEKLNFDGKVKLTWDNYSTTYASY